MTAGDVSWSAAVAMAVLGALGGLLVPRLIARIPEPEPAPVPEDLEVPDPASERDAVLSPAEHSDVKERYDTIAARPGLALRTGVSAALVCGVLGLATGWGPELAFLGYLGVVGVALAVVDWRTRLLPTWLIAPSYVAVGVLAVLASAVGGDWGALVRAAGGWLVAGGTFFALWFIYPKGMGYGDVRLSGVLGIALGWLGWGELLVGVYAGFLLGGFGGLLLSMLRVVDRKAYPFGPFMLAGAVIGVVAGPGVAAWYG